MAFKCYFKYHLLTLVVHFCHLIFIFTVLKTVSACYKLRLKRFLICKELVWLHILAEAIVENMNVHRLPLNSLCSDHERH